ncbi:MAG: DUF5668 domain-containing protein [Candidatus Saccharimonadales bacterium]
MKNTSITRNITGIIIIVIGVVAIISIIGSFDFGAIFSVWWPILVIIGGLLIYMNDRRQLLWSILLAVIGTLFLIDSLDLANYAVWNLVWPILIIGVGASILMNKTGTKLKPNSADTTTISALLSGSDIKNHSENYKGGNLSSILGGINIDLRDATMKGTSTLNVFVFMGGIELYVPKGWKIQSNVTSILGGVDGRALEAPTEKNCPTLVITGDVMLGGINIKH